MSKPLPQPSWHLESMSRFYESDLPRLLRRKLPLEAHDIRRSGGLACEALIVVTSSAGPVSVRFGPLPLPDESGVFAVEGRQLVVVPIAETEDLGEGCILCAGEQLGAWLEDHLGGAPTWKEWDEPLVRELVPLERLIREFLLTTGQALDTHNWLARATHLRRILNPGMRSIMPDSHTGRVCPIDTPNQPESTGKVLTLCRAATIQSGRILATSDDPVNRLGPVTALVPFLDHDAPVRAQMGVQLMRQWNAAARPETALVQTGLEPDDAAFWIGCNLLTAFVSCGKDTYEDSLLLSETGASRLGFTVMDCIGAVLSNRHGQKGVVGKVLPDGEMPLMPDGVPAELVVSFIGLHTRMNTGQLFEAMASWIAQKTGRPFLAPPFSAVDHETLARLLSGVPHLRRLRHGRGGANVEQECLVGWVYWAGCGPRAATRMKTCARDGEQGCMRQGEMENHVLIQRGAWLTIREHLTTLASDKAEETPWSSLFDTLRRRLSAVGIAVDISESRLVVKWAEPPRDGIRLAAPLRHPWLPDRTIHLVGKLPDVEGWDALENANRALLDTALPESLSAGRLDRLQSLLDAFFVHLLTPETMRLGSRIRRSGRAIIAVAAELACDEVGIPSRMARDLWGEAGLPEWVIVNRAPTMETTAICAFHPAIVEGDAVRLNPFVCRWMNADFDGDMVAVLVPGTRETQEEAGRLLSVVGHVTAAPSSLDTLAPNGDALWGLAHLWMSENGKKELMSTLPFLDAREPVLTGHCVVAALGRHLEETDPRAAVEKTVELWERGFAEARRIGGTLDPFALSSIPLPTPPRGDEREDWLRHAEQCVQALSSADISSGPSMESQLLAVRSRARGDEGRLARLVAGSGYQEDRQGRSRIVRSGLLAGMGFDDYAHLAAIDHEQTIESLSLWVSHRHPGFPDYRPYRPAGSHVLARAMRSVYPGIVFARAAESGETDPLTDIDARLFVGLLPQDFRNAPRSGMPR